jgi:hypothetical protein
MLYALIQKIVLFDDKVEIYFNYVKNYYPDDFSPEIARDSSFIECSIDFLSGAPKKRDGFIPSRFFAYRKELNRFSAIFQNKSKNT